MQLQASMRLLSWNMLHICVETLNLLWSDICRVCSGLLLSRVVCVLQFGVCYAPWCPIPDEANLHGGVDSHGAHQDEVDQPKQEWVFVHESPMIYPECNVAITKHLCLTWYYQDSCFQPLSLKHSLMRPKSTPISIWTIKRVFSLRSICCIILIKRKIERD